MRAARRPRLTRTVPRAGVAIAVLTLATACGGAPDGTPSSTTTTATPPSMTSSPPSTTPSTSSATPSPTTSPSPAPTPSAASPTATALPAWLLGQDVRLVPTTHRIVVLTFDGGGNADGLARILATLDAKHVPGTFFLTGRWVQAYPEGARRIVAAGHVVGNHTMTHPHSTQLTDAALTTEVLRAAQVITSTTRVSPKPWFRFPYGERTSADIRLLNGLGYACVSWGVDTLGWLGTSRGTADDVRQRVLAALEPGLIVLMHLGSNPDDGTTYDADALASVIDAVRARGYSFATVTELLTAGPPR